MITTAVKGRRGGGGLRSGFFVGLGMLVGIDISHLLSVDDILIFYGAPPPSFSVLNFMF
jgi:hypothetical protein